MRCHSWSIVSLWEESPSFCQEGCGCFLLLVAEHKPSMCFLLYFLFEFFVKQVLSFQIFYRYSELFISQQVCFSCPQRIKYPFRKTMCYSSFNHWYSLVSFILWVSTRSAALSLGHFLAFSYSFPHETNFLLFLGGLCWAFVVAPGLSLVAASWGYSLIPVCRLPLWWVFLLKNTDSRVCGLQ